MAVAIRVTEDRNLGTDKRLYWTHDVAVVRRDDRGSQRVDGVAPVRRQQGVAAALRDDEDRNNRHPRLTVPLVGSWWSSFGTTEDRNDGPRDTRACGADVAVALRDDRGSQPDNGANLAGAVRVAVALRDDRGSQPHSGKRQAPGKLVVVALRDDRGSQHQVGGRGDYQHEWRSPFGATEDRNVGCCTRPIERTGLRLPFEVTEDRNRTDRLENDSGQLVAVALWDDRGSQRGCPLRSGPARGRGGRPLGRPRFATSPGTRSSHRNPWRRSPFGATEDRNSSTHARPTSACVVAVALRDDRGSQLCAVRHADPARGAAVALRGDRGSQRGGHVQQAWRSAGGGRPSGRLRIVTTWPSRACGRTRRRGGRPAGRPWIATTGRTYSGRPRGGWRLPFKVTEDRNGRPHESAIIWADCGGRHSG